MDATNARNLLALEEYLRTVNLDHDVAETAARFTVTMRIVCDVMLANKAILLALLNKVVEGDQEANTEGITENIVDYLNYGYLHNSGLDGNYVVTLAHINRGCNLRLACTYLSKYTVTKDLKITREIREADGIDNTDYVVDHLDNNDNIINTSCVPMKITIKPDNVPTKIVTWTLKQGQQEIAGNKLRFYGAIFSVISTSTAEGMELDINEFIGYDKYDILLEDRIIKFGSLGYVTVKKID